MRLSSISIKDFKRVKSANVPLADLNILVGANSSGKSSIIQAIHLATCLMRQASRVDSKNTSAVGVNELDYLPSDNYSMLGHLSQWGNKTGSPSSQVEFIFEDPSGFKPNSLAKCEIRSARNEGISITGQIPAELNPFLRDKKRFFSAYIPGISGIPNKEEKRSKKVVMKACSYGDSNVILRNVLLLLKEQGRLETVEKWISQLIGDITLHVEYDDEKNLTIDCSAEIERVRRPIELIGTGYLQLLQLFSYVLIFTPGILLIDEPDIHLHPSVQEKLPQVLSDVAKQQGVRVLLTTHSPFIVRGAPITTNVHWVSEGTIKPSKRSEVELALGWGGFGKRILFYSEDTDISWLRKLISQWPQIERFVAYYPGTGFKFLPTVERAKEIRTALGNNYKIVVHRDRDSMTDDEAEKLQSHYAAEDIHLWMPQNGDIESYFCLQHFIEEVVGCTPADAAQHIQTALSKASGPIEDQFVSQRKAINDNLHSKGGSPSNDDVKKLLAVRPLGIAKGKTIFKQLTGVVGQDKFSTDVIAAHSIKNEIAMDLRHLLEGILANS
jgi:AAA15 family ATPase/GTPase